MSYVGYIPLVKEYVHTRLPPPRTVALLEVGIDRGTTLVPLVAFLARVCPNFVAIGVDVKVQEPVVLMLQNLDLVRGQQEVFCIQGNSLDVMPQLVDKKMKFDVILIDGDHNYHTVSREMSMLDDLTHPGSLVVCDDYNGRWSERDMWYAEREGYQDVVVATRPVETEKHGVKAAVDEWLVAHPNWQKAQPISGEPVMLLRTA